MIKYIIFGKNHYQYNDFDINKYIYFDAISQKNVVYIEPKESLWERYLRFFYHNEYGIAIREKFFVPFRTAAYRALLRKGSEIQREDTNIFVFFLAEPWFFDEKGFLHYLRKKYPNVRLVYHVTNIIQNVRFGPDYYRKFFDLVSTCNRGDSIKYAMPFFPNANSYISFDENSEPESDCLFVGQAKQRLHDLLAIFEILTNRGVKCEFYINGVANEDKRFEDKIHYNQVLNYNVILRKIEKTNVLLELLQEGMDTHTLRYPEAVNYGKKLLTNNAGVVREESYSEKNIRLFCQATDVADIERTFFDSPIQESYPNKDSVSSRHFLTFIKNNLDLWP